ncbi:hypothetical protein PspLS_05526 [Pyricularia sp. CBS 133598]|nr:hypothetical protein PspLS_05526 [Pyricularia sp. CBS 133598]
MVRQIPITALRAGCSRRMSGNSNHFTQFVRSMNFVRGLGAQKLSPLAADTLKKWRWLWNCLPARPVHKVRYAINRQDNPTRRKSACGAHECYSTTMKIHYYFVPYNHTCRPAPLNWMRDGEQSNNHPARSPDEDYGRAI